MFETSFIKVCLFVCLFVFGWLVVCFFSQTGKSLTFMTRENWRWAGELVKVLAEANQVMIDTFTLILHVTA